MKTTVALGGAALLVLATTGCGGSASAPPSVATVTVTSTVGAPMDDDGATVAAQASGTDAPSTDASSTDASSAAPADDASARSFHPPTAFLSKAAGRLPEDSGFDEPRETHAVLVGRTVYGMTSARKLVRIDLGSQPTQRWEVNVLGKGSVWGANSVRPAVTDDGATVLTAEQVEMPGVGTEKGSRVVHVTAVSAENAQTVWTHDIPTIPTKEDPLRTPTLESVRITPAGVLVSAEDDTMDVTVLLDLKTGKPLWTIPNRAYLGPGGSFAAIVTRAPAADSRRTQIRALDPRTGAPGAVVLPDRRDVEFLGGSSGVVVTSVAWGDASEEVHLLSGTTAKRIEGVDDCRPPRAADTIFVCEAKEGPGMRAFDLATGAELWRLPTETRTAPTGWLVYGDRLYGNVEGQLAVLDGRTGKDLSAAPSESDEIVEVSDFGVIKRPNSMVRDLDWHPATS